MIGTLWAALHMHSYVLSIIFCIAQVGSQAYDLHDAALTATVLVLTGKRLCSSWRYCITVCPTSQGALLGCASCCTWWLRGSCSALQARCGWLASDRPMLAAWRVIPDNRDTIVRSMSWSSLRCTHCMQV